MVELRKIVEALQADPRTDAYYYDREGDCLVQFTTDVSDYDSRTLYEDTDFDAARYILLERDEFFEEEIMEAFVLTVEDPVKANKLECAANRHGAAKHFRNTVLGLCLEKEWADFRGDRYRNEARHICDAYGIPYE